MELIVLKFGGTSLANIKLMKNAAAKVAEHVNHGYKVIVVVSAMAGVTDNLSNLVNEISECNNQEALAEYANVITTGEQVSAGLFSLILQEMKIKSRSWTNWQIGIITDDNFADGEIIKLECNNIIESFNQGLQVAVVAGFQGITADGRNSTLGRGGSDTSAIIIAGAVKAKKCDIYTDVEGVFTGDPRIIAKAHKIAHINYDAMIAFADAGAKVLQAKSVKWAKHHQVKVQVLSSFTGNPGTIITHLEEAKPIIGVALSNIISLKNQSHLEHISKLNIAKISIIGTNIENNNSIIEHLEKALKQAKIEILVKQTEFMTLSFIIEDQYKFDAIKLVHKTCNLEESLTTN